jgi:geranylgeranyl diphosphate synthase, type II
MSEPGERLSDNKRHPAVKALQAAGKDLDQAFTRCIKGQKGVPRRLLQAMVYSFTAGGKRLRPALVLECFNAVKKPGASKNAALAAALAIELIHTFSLIHDDLPAMDDDDLRRGQPTNHIVFGEAVAILAGDALTALAFGILSDVEPAKIAVRLVKELAKATGPAGMIGGQILDIEGENKCLLLSELQELHQKKTGALLTSACRLGALAGGASKKELETLTEFGQHLGLAFQIVDDILDETSTPRQLGKATQKDRPNGKNTYPTLIGLEESRQKAQVQLNLAIKSIQGLGRQGKTLRQIAEFVVMRTV